MKRLRQVWPHVRLILRADSGFCRHRMLSWCERHDVGYITGLAKNARLNGMAGMWMGWAEAAYNHGGDKQRLFAEFRYGAHTWKTPRRVIARLEHGPPKGAKGGANPRYVVTNLEGMKHSTASAATWRTASRSSSSTCSPTAPRATTGGPISSG